MAMTVTDTTGSPAGDATTGDATTGDATFASIVARLSRQSVDKRFDAYGDVNWDAYGDALDAADPRWRLWAFDPLAETPWYRRQPPEAQARIAMHRVAAAMRVGWEFENLLQRGLLSFAFRLANGRPEFRYIHHEIIEESQHTMMFQELVNRTGLAVGGLTPAIKLAAERLVLPLSRRFPALFFLFVLGGEDPVDHLQRLQLRNGDGHPLVERIMRIHVTEEARHLSFARNYLKSRVPELGPVRRTVLAIVAPVLFGIMARLMLTPPAGMRRAEGIPRSVLRRAMRSPSARTLLADSVAKPRRLCAELGLVNPVSAALWRLMGVGGLHGESGARTQDNAQ